MLSLFLLLWRACCFCLDARSIKSETLGIPPKLGVNSKRIALDADATLVMRPNQYRHCFVAVFIVLGLVVGQAPKAIPFQKNQLAAPPRCCFYCAGVGTSYFYCLGCACYCCCASNKAEAVPVFVNPCKTRV